jgi:hypothetical protein
MTTTRNSQRGYSLRIAEMIRAGDPEHVGVKLGRICLAQNIPVHEVAARLGVSRQAVYQWFAGRFYPKAEQEVRIKTLLAELSGHRS